MKFPTRVSTRSSWVDVPDALIALIEYMYFVFALILSRMYPETQSAAKTGAGDSLTTSEPFSNTNIGFEGRDPDKNTTYFAYLDLLKF